MTGDRHEKAWPAPKRCRERSAGRRAFLDRKRGAARLACVPGWFAAAPGASQAPAFPGAPSPRFGDAREGAKLGRACAARMHAAV